MIPDLTQWTELARTNDNCRRFFRIVNGKTEIRRVYA